MEEFKKKHKADMDDIRGNAQVEAEAARYRKELDTERERRLSQKSKQPLPSSIKNDAKRKAEKNTDKDEKHRRDKKDKKSKKDKKDEKKSKKSKKEKKHKKHNRRSRSLSRSPFSDRSSSRCRSRSNSCSPSVDDESQTSRSHSCSRSPPPSKTGRNEGAVKRKRSRSQSPRRVEIPRLSTRPDKSPNGRRRRRSGSRSRSNSANGDDRPKRTCVENERQTATPSAHEGTNRKGTPSSSSSGSSAHKEEDR